MEVFPTDATVVNNESVTNYAGRSKDVAGQSAPINPVDHFSKNVWLTNEISAGAYSVLFWGNVDRSDANAYGLACASIHNRYDSSMALFLLAQIHHAGDGVDKNDAVANNFMKAAFESYPNSSDIGVKNMEKIFKNHLLGVFFSDANNAQKNLDKACEYYKIAADLEHKDSAYALAEIYDNKPANTSVFSRFMTDYQGEANRYYYVAAKQGHPDAAYRLVTRIDAQRDRNDELEFVQWATAAVRFYALAVSSTLASQEDKAAWANKLFSDGLANHNLSESAKSVSFGWHAATIYSDYSIACYEAAADLGHGEAASRAAKNAAHVQDFPKAIKYYQIALTKDPSYQKNIDHIQFDMDAHAGNNPEAEYRYGMTLVNQDPDKAKSYFERVLEKDENHVGALFALGCIFENKMHENILVQLKEEYKNKAMDYYKKAADLGSRDASEAHSKLACLAYPDDEDDKNL